MGGRSKIEWTDATWNPVRGCTRVSEGCRNCYAEVMAARFSDPGQWGHGFATRVQGPRGQIDHRWTGNVALVEDKLDLPLRWKKPRRIFVNATSDLFHEDMPDLAIDLIFAVMALAPQHTFQVLTKRPERMRAYIEGACGRVADATQPLRKDKRAVGPLPHLDPGARWWPLPNVWLGTSVEDRRAADERIPHLLATPAALRFLSCEPLLGPVQLDDLCDGHKFVDALRGNWWHDGGRGEISRDHPKIDWVIGGGESGPGARPMDLSWARSLRDQCASAGVAFFMKQIDKKAPIPADLMVREFPHAAR